MQKLSPLQRISACLIAINFFAINLFVILTSLIQKNKEEDFSVSFKGFSRKSQLCKILDEGTVRVAIQDNNAYWVIDNILYKADISKDGKILNENAVRVDVFDLSEKGVLDHIRLITLLQHFVTLQKTI
jgi:ABC-type uncharacterized transport system ATPase subunit